MRFRKAMLQGVELPLFFFIPDQVAKIVFCCITEGVSLKVCYKYGPFHAEKSVPGRTMNAQSVLFSDEKTSFGGCMKAQIWNVGVEILQVKGLDIWGGIHPGGLR